MFNGERPGRLGESELNALATEEPDWSEEEYGGWHSRWATDDTGSRAAGSSGHVLRLGFQPRGKAVTISGDKASPGIRRKTVAVYEDLLR